MTGHKTPIVCIYVAGTHFFNCYLEDLWNDIKTSRDDNTSVTSPRYIGYKVAPPSTLIAAAEKLNYLNTYCLKPPYNHIETFFLSLGHSKIDNDVTTSVCGHQICPKNMIC